MTVGKAIKGLDFLIQNKHEVKTGLLDPEMSWNKGDPRIITSFVEGLASLLQRDIDSLRAIKRQLLPEQHRTKIVCRHPKKDHDTDGNGQKYCMACNANL